MLEGVSGAAGRVAKGVATGAVALGIDIGGTGVKAAVVDTGSGELLTNRVRLKTPTPSTPAAVAETLVEVIAGVAAEQELSPDMPAGCGLPSVIKAGEVFTAANIDKSWIGANAETVFGQALGRRVHAINDADAAGLAEMRFGAGRGRAGTVLLLTIGTGIGSALFIDGRLVPNTELGHMEFQGDDAEHFVSGAAREQRGLSWKKWVADFNTVLARYEDYLWPDLIILGGGVSKSSAKFWPLLRARAEITPAHFLNVAGIIGAAMAGVEAERG
jgi:polyphosphate glucokinase